MDEAAFIGGDDSLVLGFESGKRGGGVGEFGAIGTAEGEDDVTADGSEGVDLVEVGGAGGGGTVVAPDGLVGGAGKDEGEGVVGLAGGGFEGGEFAGEVGAGIDFEVRGEDLGGECGVGGEGKESKREKRYSERKGQITTVLHFISPPFSQGHYETGWQSGKIILGRKSVWRKMEWVVEKRER